MHDKLALTTNPAGMRLIAQMTLYNAGKWERLDRYIADSYAEPLLVAVSVSERLRAFTADYQVLGRLKVGFQILIQRRARLRPIGTKTETRAAFPTTMCGQFALTSKGICGWQPTTADFHALT